MRFLNIFLLVASALVPQSWGRDYDAMIEPYANTHWGSWGPIEFCPEGSFAYGYQMKVEPPCGDCDDTVLNTIRLLCAYHLGDQDLEAGYVESTSGPFGSWQDPIYCPGGGNFLKGAQFMSEPAQYVRSGDDTAGNDLNMECLGGEILEGGSPTQW